MDDSVAPMVITPPTCPIVWSFLLPFFFLISLQFITCFSSHKSQSISGIIVTRGRFIKIYTYHKYGREVHWSICFSNVVLHHIELNVYMFSMYRCILKTLLSNPLAPLIFVVATFTHCPYCMNDYDAKQGVFQSKTNLCTLNEWGLMDSMVLGWHVNGRLSW